MNPDPDKEQLTQWWVEHPNEGWKPVPPCDACDGLVIFGWRVRLGCPEISGVINYANGDWVIESAFWAARFKGLSGLTGNGDIKIGNLVQTLCDKLKYSLDDDYKEFIRDQVAIMLDHESKIDEQVALLKAGL